MLLYAGRMYPTFQCAKINKKGEMCKNWASACCVFNIFSTVLVLYKICFLVHNMFPCDLINLCSGAAGSYCRNVILSYFANQIHWPRFLSQKNISHFMYMKERRVIEHRRQQDHRLRNRNDVVLNLSKKLDKNLSQQIWIFSCYFTHLFYFNC